jgi:putative peptidoglycan lipid II flippase
VSRGEPTAADSGASGSGARWVALGILASRLAGFVRDRALAYFFGIGPHADVFRAALKGPNLIQNLLGEGSLSAAFIPVYSRLLHEGRERDAGRLAGAVFSLLLAVAATLALLGIVFARPLVALFAPGFLEDAAAVAAGTAEVDRFELAVSAVRFIFPMTGVLVLSAWALGVLNSHRRFLIAYLAPVAWNAAILAALLGTAAALVPDLFAGFEPQTAALATRDRLLLAACAGALGGAVLQLAVQLPSVVRVLRGFRLSLSTRVVGVRPVLAAFAPAVAGRGVYQLSAYLDQVLASLLAAGALASLGFAQTLYVLPVALFGLSLAAAELPELSRAGEKEIATVVGRVGRSVEQMGFLVLPTVVGYLGFGWLLVGALYRTGGFGREDNALVALVLAAYALGLPATTVSRLLQNTFFALRDTRTPARIAGLRLVAGLTVGVPAMFVLDRWPVTALPGLSTLPLAESPLFLGSVGLAFGSAVGAWLELAALYRALARRLAGFRLPWWEVGKMAALALVSAAPAAGLWWALPALHVALTALLVVGLYAALYLGLARALGMSRLGRWLGRLGRR